MARASDQTAVTQVLERQIRELERASDSEAAREEIERLRHQLDSLRQPGWQAVADAWSRVLLARHPQRPYTLDYIQMLFTDFMGLHGDRRFADDPALVGGLARFEGRPVMVVGHQKGRDTKQKLQRNFGMTHPEGYRKALRLMNLADKFGMPIITLVDTPGAYPGIGAEERGQAEAIAYNLKEIPRLRVPILVVIHGEGGSGGALAIAVGDKVLMLENAVYSVISPESCSSILWRDWDHKQEAARILKLTAEDLHSMEIVDQVVPEPPGGAHADPARAAEFLRSALSASLQELETFSTEELLRRRHARLRQLASFVTEE
ncbi:MAG: acetyl-CoA carboxylase carboxyl transferase subunit alpha [Acidobacteria bacterium]|nr:MAG: acetyl-CoA carboxylase carboxyl transferase subunit alpha [Acidobacteriota bacterium]